MKYQLPLIALLGCILSACSTHYQTLKVDERSGQYPTSSQVDAGGVLTYDTSVDSRGFPVVLLITNANIRPSGFEFTVRHALAQSGFSRVYTIDEFRLLAADKGFAFADEKIDAEAVRRFSSQVAPVLVVDITYRFVGDARMRSLLIVGDGRTGKALLRVDHHKTVWSDFDAEALYPVLNQLRKWIRDSSKGAT